MKQHKPRANVNVNVNANPNPQQKRVAGDESRKFPRQLFYDQTSNIKAAIMKPRARPEMGCGIDIDSSLYAIDTMVDGYVKLFLNATFGDF